MNLSTEQIIFYVSLVIVGFGALKYIIFPLALRLIRTLFLHYLLSNLRPNDVDKDIIFLAVKLSIYRQLLEYLGLIMEDTFEQKNIIFKETQWLLDHLRGKGYKEGSILKTLIHRLSQKTEYGFQALPQQAVDARMLEVSESIDEYFEEHDILADRTRIELLALIANQKLIQYLKA